MADRYLRTRVYPWSVTRSSLLLTIVSLFSQGCSSRTFFDFDRPTPFSTVGQSSIFTYGSKILGIAPGRGHSLLGSKCFLPVVSQNAEGSFRHQ